MPYISTRGTQEEVSFLQVLQAGLAPRRRPLHAHTLAPAQPETDRLSRHPALPRRGV